MVGFDLNIRFSDECVDLENDNVVDDVADSSAFGDDPNTSAGEGNFEEVSPTEEEATNKDDNGDNAEASTSKQSESICNAIEERLVVGSRVDGFDQAYVLYCEYARCKGFSVLKGEQRYIGKSEEIRWKQYVCSGAGLPDCKSSNQRVPAFKKMVTRTGCNARLRVTRSADASLKIIIFESEHNHALVPPDQTYLLRSARNLCHAKLVVMEVLNSVGIGVSRVCGFMERESGGPENGGFTRQDAYNRLKHLNKASKVDNFDSAAILEYFIKKSNEEPFFYWKVELDDDRLIMNFFFRDSQCANDYHAFGDVLSVDTTYRTNRYNLICAPFVGINHHMNNVMFGIAFLSDETSSSFEWLFGAFLESMNGVEPKVIFTDQCQSMMNVIDKVFPNTKHRLCQWHINQNAPAHFGSLNGDSTFKKLWHHCMNSVDTESEFEDVWKHMIETYNLKEKKWFAAMYHLRHRWAAVFTCDLF